MCGEQMAGGSALTSSSVMRTSRRSAIASTSRRTRLHDAFAAGRIGVADVDLQSDAAGNAVDRAGIDVAGADGGDGVDRAGGERVLFDGQMSSAAAQSASRRSGIRSAPAWPPKPSMVKR